MSPPFIAVTAADVIAATLTKPAYVPATVEVAADAPASTIAAVVAVPISLPTGPKIADSAIVAITGMLLPTALAIFIATLPLVNPCQALLKTSDIKN
jgi:coenzyme F420-reducing hydrogenase beta subunit